MNVTTWDFVERKKLLILLIDSLIDNKIVRSISLQTSSKD